MQEPKISLSPSEQLLLMRNTTDRFGILMEGQALQLRLWPFAVDPGLENAEAHVDLDAKRLVYDWRDSGKSKNWKPNAAYKTRLLELEKMIKQVLLGEDWIIEVKMNGNRIKWNEVDSVGKRKRTSSRKVSRKRPRKSS